MKKFLVFFILFAVLFIPEIGALNVKKVGKAVLDYQASGVIEVSGYLNELEINISALPQNGICKYNTGKIIKDEYGNLILSQKYRDVYSDVEWWIKCEIDSEKSFAKLTSVPKFPKFDYEENIKKYLKFTDLTQPSERVKLKANEITKGSSTTLEASLRLAEWVANNVEYDMSYGEELKPASWVVENLRGVCSEYSHLLISFLRSVGIPSRYAVGYVYSSEYEDFQPHSWVEVYLNEWLPLDPTFNEFGNIDALHIRLRHSLDGNESLVEIKYLAGSSNVKVKIKKPEVRISIVSMENETEFLVSSLKLNKNLFGENDYALLTVSVENPTSYWIPTTLLVNKPKGLKLTYGAEANAIWLEPGNTKHFYFVFNTPSNLKEDYVYTYPVVISVLGAEEKRINLKVDPAHEQKSSLEELLFSIKKEETEEKHKIRIQELKVPEIVYETPPNITINLKNVGNVAISNLILNVKYDDKDLNYSIGRILINEEKNLTFALPLPTKKGRIPVLFSLIAENVLTSFQKTLIHAEKPEVKISYVGPDEITNFEPLNFELHINIIGNVSRAKLTIKTQKTFLEKNITQIAKINYSLPADSLEVGKNEIIFSIEVVDVYGQKFTFTETKTVERKISNLLVRLIILIKKLLKFFRIF
jgi:hypothetical protein